MSVPGCFSFLRRKEAPEPQRAARLEARTPPASTPEPRRSLPEKHEHYEPCGCGDALSALRLKSGNEDLPPYVAGDAFSSDVRDTVRVAIDSYTDKLTDLSIYISDHPELGFKEFKSAERIVQFLRDEGFEVETGYKDLETAFRATYTHGKGGRTFAFNSEYDALPGVGHACGHNLIAVAGIAATLGLRAALKKHNIDGAVTLIGTPAEEGGVGKGILLERGGYKGADACMMIHPVGDPSGKAGFCGVIPTLAIQTINVEFFGRTSHAGGAPWDGINALDAAHLAYASVSALRQQIHTTDRVHGIIVHGGDAPNIIPEYTSMRWYVRAQSGKGVETLMGKMKDIFDAAGKATGCTVKYKTERLMNDLRNNLQLAEEFASAMGDLNLPTQVAVRDFSTSGGSTDFGNVTYAMPACHPHYAVPCVAGRSNHTIEFRNACRTPEAHDYTWKFAGGMACVGARFVKDEKFAKEARKWWQDDMKDA